MLVSVSLGFFFTIEEYRILKRNSSAASAFVVRPIDNQRESCSMLGPSGGVVADKQRDVTKTRQQTNSRSAPTLCAVRTLRHTHARTTFLDNRACNNNAVCAHTHTKKHFRSLSSTIYTHTHTHDLFSLSGISESDIKLTNKPSNIISWTKTQCIDFSSVHFTHTHTHICAHNVAVAECFQL